MSAVGARSPAPATLGERWRLVPRHWRVVMIAISIVVVVEFALSLVGNLYTAPSSSPVGSGSSVSAAPDGTQALALLLSARHHPVQQATVPLANANLPVNGTVFVLDPVGSLTAEIPTLKSYVRNGGRLVLSGEPNHALLSELLGPGALPVWDPVPAGSSRPAVNAPEVNGVTTVLGDASGSWSSPTATESPAGQITVLLQGPENSLALLARVGQGTVVLLGSSGPLQDQYLASADDAAFALDLAGNAKAPVLFDEYDHGLGRSGTGLAGLPAHWRIGLALALAAALVWVLSAARRFGPPQRANREFIPPRVAHVDAMASLLASGDPQRRAAGAAPLQREGRATLRRMLRAEPNASDEHLVELAAQGGVATVTPEEVTALLGTPRSADELVRLGTAFTAIERDHHR